MALKLFDMALVRVNLTILISSVGMLISHVSKGPAVETENAKVEFVKSHHL